MVSKSTNPATNGKGQRKCTSWIESFVDQTENTEAPEIFRKWAGITAIAAVLEQKVWLTTSSNLYPNIYTFLVGHPGVGKTRVIRAMKSYLSEVPEFHFAPTSLTAASLVDALVEAKRFIPQPPAQPLEYNAMTITAEELTAFIHKYEEEMIGVLSAFYDPDPYLQHRRGKDIRIKIKLPQLNIISGTTPSNLLKFLPEFAWDQGFTSRVMLIYGDRKDGGDDFAHKPFTLHPSLVHDLRTINMLHGAFKVTKEYHDAVKDWRAADEKPFPNHPKLLHYRTRRRTHLYKLSMVSALDRANALVLGIADFNRAMGWLVEAELKMPLVFTAGASGADAKAMDEIYHFCLMHGGTGVPEYSLINFSRKYVSAFAVKNVIDLMVSARMIKPISVDKTGMRKFIALEDEQLKQAQELGAVNGVSLGEPEALPIVGQDAPADPSKSEDAGRLDPGSRRL